MFAWQSSRLTHGPGVVSICGSRWFACPTTLPPARGLHRGHQGAHTQTYIYIYMYTHTHTPYIPSIIPIVYIFFSLYMPSISPMTPCLQLRGPHLWGPPKDVKARFHMIQWCIVGVTGPPCGHSTGCFHYFKKHRFVIDPSHTNSFWSVG